MPAPPVIPYREVTLNITPDVTAHPRDLGRVLAARYGVTRASSANLIRRLELDGWISRSGPSTHPVYTPGFRRQRSFDSALAGLEEDIVWQQEFSQYLSLPPNVRTIVQHGLTEMTNNAIDHSAGSRLWIQATQDQHRVRLLVADNGVGIFRRIADALHLADPRLAAFELAKGKLTTDPKRHSGEGVFFTSRMFDTFRVDANGLHFGHHGEPPPEPLIDSQVASGTRIQMGIALTSQRTTREVFDRYTDPPEDYGFNKTVVPMALAQIRGEPLLSRSQAKRLVARLDRFKAVTLDFEGVPEIGQAFADEIFRVYARAHPGVELIPLNMNEQVERMWLRSTRSDVGA